MLRAERPRVRLLQPQFIVGVKRQPEAPLCAGESALEWLSGVEGEDVLPLAHQSG